MDCRRRGDKSRSLQGYSEDRSGVLVQTEVMLELRGHHKTPPAGKRCALKCQLPGRLFTPRPAPQAAVNYQAVALTVGSAFAFGAGVCAFKGGDSVRRERLFTARRAAYA